MHHQSLKERFNTGKEELARLGKEFNSEALPLLEILCNTSCWIVRNKRAAKKIIKQTFFEAIENCDITKNYADWNSWIHRIWMREIQEFYSHKENDKQTVFDFIDHSEVNLNAVEDFFNSTLPSDKLIESLEKLPAVLRIPLIMKEIHLLNYEIISDLIDVPAGVIATRIYRARKLLYLFMKGDFDYEDQKTSSNQKGSSKLIFELRRCALNVDEELSEMEKATFISSITESELYKAEMLIQAEVKKLFKEVSADSSMLKRIRAKIERKAAKRFEKPE